MKSLSRILTVCLCCVPAFGAVAAPVATTAGSNITPVMRIIINGQLYQTPDMMEITPRQRLILVIVMRLFCVAHNQSVVMVDAQMFLLRRLLFLVV